MATYHKEYPFEILLKELRKADLFSITHALVLLDLKQGPKIQQHLADSAGIHPSNAVGVLSSLAEAGLVERNLDTLAWMLSDKGSALITPVVSHTHEWRRNALPFPDDIPEWDPADFPEFGQRVFNGIVIDPDDRGLIVLRLNCGCEVATPLNHLESLSESTDPRAKHIECTGVCKTVATRDYAFWSPSALVDLP